MTKYEVWHALWAAQRAEDDGAEPVGDLPPKYEKRDFIDDVTWALRGKLDVPKERFISYPACASDEDGEPLYGWAGWNHLKRAQALAALFQRRKLEEGWTAERLTPMLAGLLELVPWIQQWHNDLDPEYGIRMGDYFAHFVDAECHALGLSKAQLDAWRPVTRGKPATNRHTSTAKSAKPRRAREAVDANSGTGDRQEEPS